MGRHAAEVLRDALALPEEARAALIDFLIDSLDHAIDEGAEEAWYDEIRLRLEQIDSGSVPLITWEAARRRLRGHLDRLPAVRFESVLAGYRAITALSIS